ncbi:MAG: type II secretion system GspH family protein [Planctomycetes bacterium]|nr:type II secretion system GspH family protein [Planctomycetota bacterium]
MTRRAFSLVELILAIFILGIGMISIAALFPAGIKQQEIAEDDVYGPMVARHAMELLRTRLKQEDFGCFEDFSDAPANTSKVDPVPLQNTTAASGANPLAPTIPKDWIWKRPGFVAVDDTTTANRDEQGMYDIFSYYRTRRSVAAGRLAAPSALPGNFTAANLLTDINMPGIGFASVRNKLFGIPYNRAKYDELQDTSKPNYAWTFTQSGIPVSGAVPSGVVNTGNALKEPAIFITQRERYWPMPANAVGLTPTPKYVWDCMFRRQDGRILVGVFVYRVIPANGLLGGNYAAMANGQPMGTPYVTTPVNSTIDPAFGNALKDYPPIPQWVSSRPGSQVNLLRNKGDGQGNPWGAGGIDAKVGSTFASAKYSPNRDDCGVPGTGPSTATTPPTDPTALTYSETWQQPGQWFIDVYNNVHHVVEGRRTHDDGPVILAKPVPRQPYANSLVEAPTAAERTNDIAVNKTPAAGVDSLICTPGSGGDAVLGIQDIWFVPPYDANGNQLIPVFACVEEL